MKKLFVCLLLMFPIGVFATVDQNTATTIWNVKDEADAETKCKEAINQNGGTSATNATAGYYLECVKVSCTNQKNVHQKLNTYTVSCANGNKNPNAIIDAGVLSSELKAGATCSEDGAYVYFTQKTFYNCAKTTDNSDYTPSNPGNSNNTNKDGDDDSSGNKEESPNTGVEDYYIALTASAAVLIGGLFILNKKNVFKKI